MKTSSAPGGWRVYALVGAAWLGFTAGWAWLTYRETLRSFESDIRSHVAAADQALSMLLKAAGDEVSLVSALPPGTLARGSEAVRARPIEIFVGGQATLGSPGGAASAPASAPAAGSRSAPVPPVAKGADLQAIEWLMATPAADGRVVTLKLPAAEVIAGWQALGLPRSSAVTLIADGTMWLRWPHERRFVGLDVSKGPLWTAIRRAGTPSGTARILPTMTDSVERLVVWQPVSAEPKLTLAAGVAISEAAAAWRATYALPIALTAVGGLAALVLMLLARARATGAERARDDALEALRTAERRWMLALDATELGVFDWNPQSGEIWLSPRFKAMLGYREEEFGNHYRDWESRVHPEDLPQTLADIDRHLRGLTPAYQSRHRMRTADGRWRWTIARGQIVSRDAEGRPLRMVGTQVDVTESLEAEALRDQRDRADAANRAKSEFTSRISHELRTPLNAVIGFAQLMREDASSLSPVQQERVQRILESSEHLLALIGDLLDLSRIEAGEFVVEIRPLDAAAQVAPVVAELQAAARQREVRVVVAPPTPGTGTLADPRRLHQVLLNLVSNAIKYNRPGGEVVIGVSAAPQDDGTRWVRYDVSDTGPGMSAEQLGHLFEPFNRLGAEHSAVEGTGIGLTICRQLLERMGGRIEVSSRLGQGSRFSALLPGCDAPADTAPAPAAVLSTPPSADVRVPAAVQTGPEARAVGDGLPLRVLYVEDNLVNVLLVQQMTARRAGVVLESVSSGAEALARVRTAPPDLLLVDMNLGDMNGLQLRAALAAEPQTDRIACVALSADALPAQIEAAQAAGFLDYLTKPLKMAALLSVYDRAASGTLAAQALNARAAPRGS